MSGWRSSGGSAIVAGETGARSHVIMIKGGCRYPARGTMAIFTKNTTLYMGLMLAGRFSTIMTAEAGSCY